MVYGLWFQIYYTLPETNREGKPLKIGHSKRKFMGFQPSIFRGDLLVSGRVKQPKWGHVSTVCLSNRRTRTILEIESVPPNKNYRVGLNVSKELYQVSKWNETRSLHTYKQCSCEFSTQNNSISQHGNPTKIQEKIMRWFSWSMQQHVNPTTSRNWLETPNIQ